MLFLYFFQKTRVSIVASQFGKIKCNLSFVKIKYCKTLERSANDVA